MRYYNNNIRNERTLLKFRVMQREEMKKWNTRSH
ncbi:hypothetical protein RUMOBE_02619 [Blautia obeum ATCC 29174]|uniref:Uncharacterized protein n=1 Tax=Blautia obeum ATCC 29174 TaxID=411459 RepID=A5ZUD5_9FIRM|nr:hypothetical protein RUMOBE_02619 [Blautia obeum ATCC 29174]